MQIVRPFSRPLPALRAASLAGSRTTFLAQRAAISRTITQTAHRAFVTEADQQKSYKTGDRQPGEEYAKTEGAARPGFIKDTTALWSLSPYLTSLLAVGVGLTGYGLYEMYGAMTMWPPEIREDLRSGLLARRKGDFDVASQYLGRAWTKAKSTPLDAFGDQPLIKLTGVGIVLASVLEEGQKKEEAYQIYDDTLQQLSPSYRDPPSSNRPDIGLGASKVLNAAERMRAVALAYKLGELAHDLQKPEEEEKWLTSAVEAIIKNVLVTPPLSGEVGNGQGPVNATPQAKVEVQDLGLPPWTMVHDLAAPFEALGSFYARHGNINYAMPLYLQAIAILIPPAPAVPMPTSTYIGAQLMSNVAELILRNHPSDNVSPEVLHQAESWAKKGLDITATTRERSPYKHSICEEAYAIMLYNLAMISEFAGDKEKARQLLYKSLDHSKSISMQDGISHAEEALHSLDMGSTERIKPFA
ncbi:hypothetical protein NLJ89_g181 [Agrocybe chaxingu]|uniref:Uncharacterized protein n=1 Tax=Agrocybe chaxingu TaxID=84603 RepID=A0A9W8TGR7_9AGAR|nr:hypothetical protein NLJ89_g181 [Agrocybe chaxingu]